MGRTKDYTIKRLENYPTYEDSDDYTAEDLEFVSLTANDEAKQPEIRGI